MADFAPPAGPPPPKVPEGWKAQWNDQYKEWFYVNIYTKKSQWERPTEPIYGPPSDQAPPGPPPSYTGGQSQYVGPEKGGMGSNNPYGATAGGSNVSEDERLARQLQAEEDARAQGKASDRGAADSYYGAGGSAPQQQVYGQSASPYSQSGGQYGQSSSSYGQQELPPRDQSGKKGFLGKLLGKSSSSQQPQYSGYPQQAGYGGYPPQQQGYYGAQQPQYYQQQPVKKHHGLGAGGGAALGLGGGLLGGMMLGEMLEDHNGDGGDGGGDGGGDFGGGDGGGGDFGGGDMGGGDF